MPDPSSAIHRLYVWLDGDPESTPPDMSIPDTPGVSDLDQLAAAVERGELGRYLPVTIRFADREDPAPRRVRAIDTAKLLRDHHIRHRRRYEVFSDAIAANQPPEPGPRH